MLTHITNFIKKRPVTDWSIFISGGCPLSAHTCKYMIMIRYDKQYLICAEEDLVSHWPHRQYWHSHSRSLIWYNTIQYNTVQYSTVQYNTMQYNKNCTAHTVTESLEHQSVAGLLITCKIVWFGIASEWVKGECRVSEICRTIVQLNKTHYKGRQFNRRNDELIATGWLKNMHIWMGDEHLVRPLRNRTSLLCLYQM